MWKINKQWQIDVAYDFQYKYCPVVVDIYSHYGWVKL